MSGLFSCIINVVYKKRRPKTVVTMIQKYEILLMHFRDGQSLREISRETGISRPTVTKYSDPKSSVMSRAKW